MHSKYQLGGIKTLAAIFCAVQGLTGALPGNPTLVNNGAAVNTTTLGDGRAAWQILGGTTSVLNGPATQVTGFYSGHGFARFIWNGFHAGNNDCRMIQIGNLFYLNITAGRFTVTSINGQPISLSPSGVTAVPGVEYCVNWDLNHITNVADLQVNGVSIATAAITGAWTLNSTMLTTVTIGENPNRGVYNLIETGFYLATQTAAALTAGQISSLAGGGYFIDILRPTHPATSPVTFTAAIIGGRPGDVHTVSLRRSAQPVTDAGSIVATGNRTGPGNISIADPATNTNGRKFYRLEVSSTGGVSLLSSHYGAADPQPGGYVLGVAPIPNPPTAVSFAAVQNCPKIGVIGNSRTPTQAALNTPYRTMRGGTTDNVTVVGAPGSGWSQWVPGAAAYSGTLNGNAFTANLLQTYLTAAALEGVTVTVIMLDVNDFAAAGTDTLWRGNVQAVITALRNAGHKVVILRDCGSEISNTAQKNFVDHETYISSLADGVNIVYSDDSWQQFVAGYMDMVSPDGTHLYGNGPLNQAGAAIGGQTANQIAANYLMLAAQTAIQPGVLLTISNNAVTIEPGQTLQRTLSVRPVNGYLGNCALAVAGLPTGVTASFSPASPLNLTSASVVSVVMNLTAAADAPLLQSPASLTVTATAGTSAPSVGVTLNVVDLTAPEVAEIVIDVDGRSVTVTMDSFVTGNAGLTFFEDGSFRALTGSLTNVDGYHLTGQLTNTCRAGSNLTWSYNPLQGNLTDVGGNEVPVSSGNATNNTGGGGASGSDTIVLVMQGPFRLTPLNSGPDDTIGATPGDKLPLVVVMSSATGAEVPVGAATITAKLVSASGTPVTPAPPVQVLYGAGGRVQVNLTVPQTKGHYWLTLMRDGGDTDKQSFGPLVIYSGGPQLP